MTTASLILERFDCAAAGAPGTADLDLDEFAAMDDAPVNPPRMEEEPLGGCDASIAEEEALQGELEAEREILRAISAQMTEAAEAIDTEVTEAAAAAMARLAGELFPAVIDAGFAAELAAATAQLVRSCGEHELRLALAPDDHDRVVAGLSALCPPLPVTVVAETTLTAGCARLTWRGGGADADTTELKARATTLLAERMAAICEGETRDDR